MSSAANITQSAKRYNSLRYQCLNNPEKAPLLAKAGHIQVQQD